MNLSLNHLAHVLKKQYVCQQLGSEHAASEARLCVPALWMRGDAPRRDLCYVVQAQQIKPGFRCPPDMSLIVVGAVRPELFRGARGAVLVLTDAPATRSAFSSCFNTVAQIFQESQLFQQRFSNLLMRSPVLQELVSLAESVFGNPVLVFDKSFCILNQVSPALQMDWTINRQTQERMLPAEVVEIIRTHPAFRLAAGDRLDVRISEEYLPYAMQFAHVARGSTVFTVAIVELGVSLDALQPQLVEYFTECVYALLSKKNVHTGHALQFETFIKKLLNNEQVEQAVVDQNLLERSWLNTDNCICAAFEVDWWDNLNATHHSVCLQIENTFAHSFAFFYADRIIAIINLDKAMTTREEMIRRLVSFLRDQMFHVGISYTFFDFSTLHSYYLQTIAALEMGRLYRPDEWCYRFEDLVLPYFMHYGTSQINGRHLCHPGLVQLWIYDYNNHTDLLNTLKVYLNTGLNATKTARQLYIHRNTFYQRMETISQIINADLNDPDVRLFMMMSFSFVELLHLKPIEETMQLEAKNPARPGGLTREKNE